MPKIVRLKNNTLAAKTWAGHVIQAGAYLDIQQQDVAKFSESGKVFSDVADGTLIVNKGTDTVDDITNALLAWKWLVGNPLVTSDDGRPIMATNRIAEGYTIFNTGASSDIAAGTYLGGMGMIMTDSMLTKEFQFLDHFYLINALAIWEGADLDDTMESTVYAPATTGLTNVAGDFTKVPFGGGNLIVPTPVGAGDWSLDLTTTLNANVAILACTPVPSSTNTGYFDYDPDSNVMTANLSGTGGYHLLDFDVTLHVFCSGVHGLNSNGAISIYGVEGIIGKRLFNTYKMKSTLTTSKSASSLKVAINLCLGVKKNV